MVVNISGIFRMCEMGDRNPPMVPMVKAPEAPVGAGLEKPRFFENSF